jgi:hypothetical protein
MRKSSKKTYHNKLWKLVSEYTRRRSANKDGYVRCFTCEKIDHWKNMDAGHFIDKSICGAELYFDERNLRPQCTRCNRYLSGAKDVYARELVRAYGAKILDELFATKKIIRKWDDERYLKEIEKYKKLIGKLNTNNQ